tara:strand:- start:25 stop:456 length:432 start_codon:yes stop_codon:yes gene_type:complete
MSPTDEMLIRIADLSAFGGGGKAAGGSSTDTIMGPGVVSGALTQAAICNASNAVKVRTKLVTEPDMHNVNLGCPELASRYIQFFKVFDGADFDPEIVAIVDSCALYARLDSVQSQCSASAICVGVGGECPGLQHIYTGFVDRY